MGDLKRYSWHNLGNEEPLFGFRGLGKYEGNGRTWARMQVTFNNPNDFLWFDIPAECLPYIPDMSEGSDFRKSGHWHHFPVDKEKGYSVIVDSSGEGFPIRRVVLNGETIFDARKMNSYTGKRMTG
jgi:hypothetical protein